MAKKHRLASLSLVELSLVDRPANKDSLVAICKVDAIGALVEVCKLNSDKPVVDFREALVAEVNNQRLWEMRDELYPLYDALRESTTAAATELTGDALDEQLRSNVAAFVEAVQAVSGSDDSNKSANEPTGSPGAPPPSNGDYKMDPKELEKKLGELETQVTELTEKNTKADTAMAAVLAAIKDGGVTLVEKDGTYSVEAPTPDPDPEPKEEFVDFHGEQIAKSAIPAPVLKRIEEQDARLKKMESDTTHATLVKRAGDELPHLAGTPDVKAELLKAVDAIEDEAVRKAVGETLKAADGATKAAFLELGKSATGADEANAPADALEKMAQDTKGSDETIEAARGRVAKSAEGQRLRKEMAN